MLKLWDLESSRVTNSSLTKVIKCLNCCSFNYSVVQLKNALPPYSCVFPKPDLQHILRQTLIFTCQPSLFDTWQIWTDDRGPPTKHCLCSVVSFFMRGNWETMAGPGGCIFCVPMADWFHRGRPVNSRLVLTAANEKREPHLKPPPTFLDKLSPQTLSKMTRRRKNQ